MPVAARSLLESLASSDVYYSVVSLWEVAIKLGSQGIHVTPRELANGLDRSGMRRLAIEIDHVERVARLQLHHRDPFDRMLVAQAEVEPLKLITVDQKLARYGPAVLAF